MLLCKLQGQKRGLNGDLMAVYNFLEESCREGSADLSLVTVTGHRAQENEMELHQKFPLDIRKRFFTSRVVSNWNRLPREVMHGNKLVRVQVASG